MLDSIILLSANAIQPDEYRAFVAAQGGVFDSPNPNEGRISKEKSHVWFFWDNAELDSSMEDDGTAILAKLGNQPHTMLVLDRNREEGSAAVAFEFVDHFFRRWPHSIIKFSGLYYSKEEISTLLMSSKF